MKFNAETRAPSAWTGDLLVIPFIDEKLLAGSEVAYFDKKLSGYLKRQLKRLEFKGEVGQTQFLSGQGNLEFDQILIVGLGKKKGLRIDDLRKAAAITAQLANAQKNKKLVSLLSLVEVKGHQPAELGQALAEGSQLALYRFLKYKGQKNGPDTLKNISFVLKSSRSKSAFLKGIKTGETTVTGVVLARDLVNTPSRDKAPEVLGKHARKLKGIRTRVFNHKQIEKMGMGALYGVGMGSAKPPVFVEMHYKPTGKVKKRVAIVGKGITFDSGGLSLKPPKGMETMKDDMAGSAAVLGTMQVLPKLKLPVEVYGYVSSAENMPDGAAQRPGDVVKAYNGKTIEVLNTDAEGRLALADALSYVSKHRKVDYIIDMATLTGAALVALGDLYTAALGTDDELIEKLKVAGEFAGEKIWQLPLVPEYDEDFKSEVADIKNIGGMWGGTINGGLFLKNFVKEDAKWVHLDIAGPSWANKPWPYSLKGGTGIMVRTLLRFFSQL